VSGVVAPNIFAPRRETRAANRSSALDCQPYDNVRTDISSAHNSPACDEVTLVFTMTGPWLDEVISVFTMTEAWLDEVT
jgi:hypothetical protein